MLLSWKQLPRRTKRRIRCTERLFLIEKSQRSQRIGVLFGGRRRIIGAELKEGNSLRRKSGIWLYLGDDRKSSGFFQGYTDILVADVEMGRSGQTEVFHQGTGAKRASFWGLMGIKVVFPFLVSF